MNVLPSIRQSARWDLCAGTGNTYIKIPASQFAGSRAKKTDVELQPLLRSHTWKRL